MYAWMSTVRPFTWKTTAAGVAHGVVLVESFCAPAAGAAAAPWPARRSPCPPARCRPAAPWSPRPAVGPHVAVAIHGADDADLREQRVADGLLVPLLGEERLEPLVLGRGPGSSRGSSAFELGGGAHADVARGSRARRPSSPQRRAGAGPSLCRPRRPRTASTTPAKGEPRALALEVRTKIDGDHRVSGPLVGVTPRCGARGRSGASAGVPLRPPAWRRTRRRPPGASRSGWPAGPESGAGRPAPC